MRHLVVIGVYDKWTVRHSKLYSAAFIVYCATNFGLSVSQHQAQVKIYERALIYPTFLNENDRSQSYKCHKLLEKQLHLCVSRKYLCDTKCQLFLYNTWEGYMLILNSLFSIKLVRYWWCGKNLICSIIICGPIQKFCVWFIVITPGDNSWYSWMFTCISSMQCGISSTLHTLFPSMW